MTRATPGVTGIRSADEWGRSIAGGWSGRWPRRTRPFAEVTQSPALFEQAQTHLLDGVPMNWMTRWAGPFPLFVAGPGAPGSPASTGTRTSTSAWATPAPWRATRRRPRWRRQGAARAGHDHHAALEDAVWVAEELARRFGLPFWQVAMTATDANRFALRIARHITGRPKVLVFNWCYHGSVDESVHHHRPDGVGGARPRQRGAGGRREPHDQGRRVQRRRGARAGAGARATSPPCSPSRPDQHRHRAARTGLPRPAARLDPRGRHPARDRRDPHDLRRPRRLHPPPLGSAGHR